jgi:MFS transporter, ACDE family, multidrug resistance protein
VSSVGVASGEATAAAPTRLRFARAVFYGIVLVGSALQTAIAPLLPAYAKEFHLSGIGAGAVVGAVGLTILGIALPAGHLADRFGPRRLTTVAGALLALGALAQAAAPSLLVLIAGRMIFGLGYGIVWTAGLAWLTALGTEKPSVSIAVASSGLGGVVGPVFAGVLSALVGTAAPIAIGGVLLAILTAALATAPAGRFHPAVNERPVAEQLRLALGDSRAIAALVAVIAAGVSTTLATLVVPIELHANGNSAGSIGVLFSLAGIAYVLVSLLTTASRSKRVATATAFVACLMVVASFTPAAVSSASTAVLAMLFATTAIRAVLWTTAYPLGIESAARTGAGVGVVTGLLNVVWAATTVVAPLLAGFASAHIGTRAMVASLQIIVLVIVLASLGYVAARRVHVGALGHSGVLAPTSGVALSPPVPASREAADPETFGSRVSARFGLDDAAEPGPAG